MQLARLSAVALSFALVACGDPAGGSAYDLGVDAALDAALDAAGDGSAPPDLAPGETVVRVHYPAAAHTLALRGSVAPLDWSTGKALAPVPGSLDTFEIHLLGVTSADGTFEVKPLLDDTTWSRGGNYRARVGQLTDVYPHFNETSGKVVALFPAFHSSKLNNTRKVWAYLPAGYDENTTARYPVLYMHDGQNLFDPATAFGGNEWKVDETLNAAAEAAVRPITELIVIGTESGAARTAELTPTMDPGEPGSGKGATYLAMLTDELKPAVDAQLRTLTDRASTGILGSSLGGLISSWAGVDDQQVFGIVGAMSPSTWWDNEVLVTHVGVTGAAPARPLRVYVDSGGPDDGGDETAHLCEAYRKIGYTDGKDFLQVFDAAAMHSEVYWAQRLPNALHFLFPPP